MPKTETVAASAQLKEVAERRAGLRATMAEVEKATSAALVGRPGDWSTALAPHIDDLRTAWAAHISGTEGPGGLWEQIRTDAPRLQGSLRRLGGEHAALTSELAVLRQSLGDAGDNESQLADVREQTTALLAQLSRHRQRGADLIYEAYEHDLGGNG